MKILVMDPISSVGVKLLKSYGYEVHLVHNLPHSSSLLHEATGLLVRSKTKITRDFLRQTPNLRIIVRVGIGLDNIDIEAAEEKNIAVFNTSGGPSHSIAELTLGMLIALARSILPASASLKEGLWIKKELKDSFELHGKNIGILGFGNIGIAFAKLAYALGMNIFSLDYKSSEKKQNVDFPVIFNDFDTLLRSVDIVSLHLPLNDRTYKLMNERAFGLMQSNSIILNTARGDLIDEDALLDALNSGKIYGAGLDVYHKEPPVNSNLTKHPRVICTPHIGGQTIEASERNTIRACELIHSFFSSDNK